MIDWDASTAHFDMHSCSNRSCHNGCSGADVTHVCGGSSFCENASVCMDEECGEAACTSSCTSGARNCRLVGADGVGSATNQQTVQEDVGHSGSIHCPWILPGEPCDATVGTRNALGRHIYEKHIDPQLTWQCPLESCSEVVQKTNLPHHQAQHQLDTYSCSWNDCLQTYRSSDDLFDHIMTNHGEFDCHFGGCEVTLKDPGQLQNHVVEEHLDFFDFSLYGNVYGDQYSPSVQQPDMNEDHRTFMQYLPTDVPAYGICTTGLGQHSAADTAQPEHQPCTHRTFADQVQSAWRESEPSRQQHARHTARKATRNTSSPAARTHSNPTNSDGLPMDSASTHGALGSHRPVVNVNKGPSSGSRSVAPTGKRQIKVHTCQWTTDHPDLLPCNKTFETAKALQEHLRRDHCTPANTSRLTPRVPAICRWNGCSRNLEPLTDTNKLIRHALTHSDYREFVCNFCSKDCTTKGQLVIHERVHTGEKPIKCQFCDKTTSNESQMAIHRRTHTGEKPHKCPLCDFRCADSTNLIKHKKSHEPNQHHCDVCGKSFGRKHTLDRHMKVHRKK